jgi:hypothetical protein
MSVSDRVAPPQGRARRGHRSPAAEEGFEALLRTLGQELDRTGANHMAGTAQARRFNGNGTVDEAELVCCSARDERLQLSRA